MTNFLLALIMSVAGILPFILPNDVDFGKQIRTAIGMFVIYQLVGWFIVWLCLPSLGNPFLGTMLIPILIFMVISSLIYLGMTESPKAFLFPSITFILFLLYSFFSTAPMCFHATDYANMIGKMDDNKSIEHWSQDITPVDPAHIRLVPQETAISFAKTALNSNNTNGSQISVGSQFELDENHCTLQKVRDRLWYVIPLDYSGIGPYMNTQGIPGYVIVDAENPKAKPQFIEKYLMKYSPESYMKHNLERHLYDNGYWNKILTDYSFEIDDSLNPHWVISVVEKTIGYSGEKVDGVIIVDPISGEFVFKAVKDVPIWVDRVFPEDVIKTYISDWGEYSGGWWNSCWAHVNQKKPEDVTLNYGADGKCYYVTPMTSISSNGASMTDLIYTDTRTGVSKRYIVGGATEEDLRKAVDRVVKYLHFESGNSVIYENIFGRMTAIISVVSEEGKIYSGVAFVDVTNKSTVSYNANPQVALHNYQTMISNSGGQIATDNSSNSITRKVVISRLNFEQTQSALQLDIYIDTIPHAFYVDCSMFPSAAFAKPGDTVIITYNNTDFSGITVSNFVDKQVHIMMSNNQMKVDSSNTETTTTERVHNNAKDIRGKMDKMTDAQLDSFYNKK